MVFVSGNFNVIHPGHLRLLRFAKECGDVLVVGVHSNEQAGSAALVDERDRLEGVRANGYVDHAFILSSEVEHIIDTLKPAIVVKGKEHEGQHNIEHTVLARYGGKLLFGSGEMQYTSADLLFGELDANIVDEPVGDSGFLQRHKISREALIGIAGKFVKTKVCVIGDLIVDEYITCEAEGMSREEPTMVVSPAQHIRYVGGGGIVAAHAAGLGAMVDYLTVRGLDENGRFAERTLKGLEVDCHLLEDPSRPSTHKTRYRVENRSLLRVNRFRRHAISCELQDRIWNKACDIFPEIDLLILSDFNYGTLPDRLLERLIQLARKHDVFISADSQCSSQLGNVGRFHGVHLLTPTEHEARVSLQDSDSGLVVLADHLRAQTQAEHVLLTLNRDGLLIHAGPEDSWVTDQLPAFNHKPVDVAGAGDCLLVAASLARCNGATIWEAGYLGSIAAGIQVSRQGNRPFSLQELLAVLGDFS